MDRNQVVCRCLNTTWGQIEDAVMTGASTYQEVFRNVKFGIGCGGCRARLKHLIMDLAYQRDQHIKQNERKD